MSSPTGVSTLIAELGAGERRKPFRQAQQLAKVQPVVTIPEETVIEPPPEIRSAAKDTWPPRFPRENTSTVRAARITRRPIL